ncbi:unnamed protein product [Sphenostylis stenocarpa]|uniref:Uncharacterized protein n=1 Tax=Sphenostylis stenocarpa TaxID=92480 RepID=A0AA86SB37_9FABA|nr:unnamed protein product [Sphenostylis stenocarpa]
MTFVRFNDNDMIVQLPSMDTAQCEVDEPYAPTYQISTKKAKKELGIEFTPLEVSVRGTVETFREKKIVNF